MKYFFFKNHQIIKLQGLKPKDNIFIVNNYILNIFLYNFFFSDFNYISNFLTNLCLTRLFFIFLINNLRTFY